MNNFDEKLKKLNEEKLSLKDNTIEKTIAIQGIIIGLKVTMKVFQKIKGEVLLAVLQEEFLVECIMGQKMDHKMELVILKVL